jgi:cellulose synthase (UDP-forming)
VNQSTTRRPTAPMPARPLADAPRIEGARPDAPLVDDARPEHSHLLHLVALRTFCIAVVVLGTSYVGWRWLAATNWDAWWIGLPLVLAETYSVIDVALFCLTMWRSEPRPLPPRAETGLTVDVYIATYDEPIDLVLATTRAAAAIRYPHETWVLDDGARPALRAAVEALGVGYLQRDDAWQDRPLHAKAGNLNNALMSTEGEFVLVLDADQVPHPEILDATLGYFRDPAVALVQTPQTNRNVSSRDALGSEAPLFYGPIQQGKDGWNAAFFCGSNAVIRREALMALGISRYVSDLDRIVSRALRRTSRVLLRSLRRQPGPAQRAAIRELLDAVHLARTAYRAGRPLSVITYDLQQRADAAARRLVATDLLQLEQDAAEFGLGPMDHDAVLDLLADRKSSPLATLAPISDLLASLDVDRADQAQPVMPMATISVTEDMATSMRLHGAGWRSIYHHETLAVGLAPEDLGTMMQQRLRWAQGTMQVMLRENPLLQRGMTLVQRLMYAATGWSYLSGFATVVYIAAPVVFLCFGVLPVSSDATVFALHFLPFFLLNQVLFVIASRGSSTRRGRQYSMALFPVWIHATLSAVGNVVLRRPLAFVVTPKTRQDHGVRLRLVRWQLVAAIALVVAAAIGVTRLVLGLGEPLGTAVNLVWVGFDLATLGVLLPALRYRGFAAPQPTT